MIDLIIKCFFSSIYILAGAWVFGLAVDRMCRAVGFRDFLILSAYGFIFVFMLLIGAFILPNWFI